MASHDGDLPAQGQFSDATASDDAAPSPNTGTSGGKAPGQVPDAAPGTGGLTAVPHDSLLGIERKLVDTMYNHTCKMMCGCLCTLFFLFLIVAGTGLMQLSTASDHDWTISDSDTSRNLDALDNALSRLDSMTGSSADFTEPRSEIEWEEAFVIMYEHASGQKDTTLFTPSNVQTMCEFENLFLGRADYKTVCWMNSTGFCNKQPKSPLRFFYGSQKEESWGYGAWDCRLLSATEVDNGATAVHNLLVGGTAQQRLDVGYHVSKTAVADGYTSAVRTQLVMGVPLPGYKNRDDRWSDQRKTYRDFLLDVEDSLFDKFGMDYSFFRSAYMDDAIISNMRVRWFALGILDQEFLRLSNGDLALSCSAMFFVFAYIWFHTGSLWLTSTAMAQILLSLPVAFFIYRVIFQITFFTQLHILAVFLVLGVGADDVFVFVDAWKQSRATCSSELERLRFSYHRASRSVFNTSFTTAFAFGATALSPIMPISSFGIYAALAIILNYLFVCTATPCEVLVYHRRWSKEAKAKKAAAASGAPNASAASESDRAAATTTLSPLDKPSDRTGAANGGIELPEVGASSIAAQPLSLCPDDNADNADNAAAEATSTVAASSSPADAAAVASNGEGAPDAAPSLDQAASTQGDNGAAAASSEAATAAAAQDDNDGPTTVSAGAGADAAQPRDDVASPVIGDADDAEVSDSKDAADDAAGAPVAPAVRNDSFDDAAVGPSRTGDANRMSVSASGAPLRRSERFFRDYYVPMLLYKYKGWKVFSWLILIAFTSYYISSVVWASRLETPRKQEEWFNSDHMFAGQFDYQKDTFLSASDDAYVEARIAFGIQGIDRSDYVIWEPDENRGIALFSDNFDVSTTVAQDFLLQTCADLRNVQCDLLGCASGTVPTTLVLPGGVSCWIEEFRTWYTAKVSSGTPVLPTGSAFITELKEFRSQSPDYVSQIGFIGGELKFVVIDVTLSLQQFLPNYVTKPVFEKMQAYTTNLAANAPASLGRVQQTSRFWTWMRTEQGLVDGMWQGLMLCGPVAFIVVCVATDNIILAFYSIVCIAGIVSCVLGAGEHYMGWSLGIGESISAVIIIGLSVDFTLHLAHMFAETDKPDRESRVAHAAVTMGVTVIAGALTTMGAGAVMLFCQMTFFTKMALLIVMTIFFSILTALLPFMALCAVLGPEGRVGTISHMAKSAYAWAKGARN